MARGEDDVLAVSLVVAMLNEAEGLPGLLDAVEEAFAGLAGGWEMIAVDDGSRDSTWDIIVRESRNRRWLRGLRLARNFGQHAAAIAGLRAASGAILCGMDADMQVAAGEVRRLAESVSEGADLAFAARDHSDEGFLKGRLGQWISRATCAGVIGSPEHPPSTFFAAKREVVERSLRFRRRRPVVSYHLMLGGPRRVVWTHPQNCPRERGVSKYGAWGLMNVAVDVFFGYTALPQKCLLGAAAAAAGGALLWAPVSAWLFLAGAAAPAALFFLSGVSWTVTALSALGFIAGRMVLDATAGGPLYVVSDTV